MENEINSMENLLADYDVKRISQGDILKGKVIDVTDKEVTVNINYAFDGVITREELSFDDKAPSEIVQPGDELDVYVVSPNDGEGYVLLSRVKALAVTEKDDLKNAILKVENKKNISSAKYVIDIATDIFESIKNPLEIPKTIKNIVSKLI